MLFDHISPAIIGCLVTFVIGALIILTQRWHGRWTLDEDHGIQKFHSQPTPRIGGLAIVSGSFLSGFILEEELNEYYNEVLERQYIKDVLLNNNRFDHQPINKK